MIELIWFLFGVIIFCSGGVVGSAITRSVLASKQPLAHLDNPNECGCNHHKSFHKGKSTYETGTCNAKDRWGNTCRCKQFIPKYPLDPFLEAAKKELMP